MGKIYFLLGGARSGKSSYAESLACTLAKKTAYIASAEIIDEEMKKRISLHRDRRPPGWVTYEFKDSKILISDYEKMLKEIKAKKISVVLFDCITILLFRLIHKHHLDDEEIIPNEVEKRIEYVVNNFFDAFLAATIKSGLDFIFVSNEVGMGVVPSYPLGRLFRDLMGNINKKFSENSDEVYFFIAGLRQKLK